ncbi:MAG: hypothetical protein EA374_04055 [Acholeplasmatales bacterium]|nr:MAG: hypothetical protein EA374_04055 [Acholeplasmatales bacterium]
MTPKKLFLQGIIVFTVSMLHLPVAWYLYPLNRLSAVIGALFIVPNIVALLWYFSLNVQLLMAYRIRRKIAKNRYVLITTLSVIIVFSALIYLWLITLFAVLQKAFIM